MVSHIVHCTLVGIIGLVGAAQAHAGSTAGPPPLPAPTGNIVDVSTESQLHAALRSLTSNTTVVIAPGTYQLTSTLWINGSFANVGVRGATNSRADVVLVGPGMANSDYGGVPHGVWVGGNVQGVTIANLTIRDIYYHPVILNAGTESPFIYNVHLINAGQQFLKANPDDRGGGVDNGVVEYSVFEYTDTARGEYTNGVDILTARDWRVRHNLFARIRAPQGLLAGPVILAWKGSSGTVAEGNTFVDCQREIAFGLVEASPDDHSGGMIRNNFILRHAGFRGDAAISVFDSPNTRVLHNTVLTAGGYPNSIEFRFPDTTGVSIVNNLVDGRIQARDGGTAAVHGNYTSATAAFFTNPAGGDLHLRADAAAAIDRGVATADCPEDWDRTARPVGAQPDVGADELDPAPGPPTGVRIIY